ncbi:MAG: response regulator [Magnetococcus sp. XQGC-1]
MGKILVIDDDVSLRTVVARLLTEAGHAAQAVASLSKALPLLAEAPFDLVYCDIRLHNECGLELLTRIGSLPQKPLVVMMTGYPSLDTAQQSIRDGAFDYLVKPVIEENLLRSVDRALAARALQAEKEHLRLHLEAVLNSVEEGLISINPALLLMSVNQTAERLCGFRQQDLHRPVTELHELLTRCHGRCLDALRRALQEGERVELPRLLCRRPDLPEMITTITAAPLRDANGLILGAVMAMRDQTRVDLLEKNPGPTPPLSSSGRTERTHAIPLSAGRKSRRGGKLGADHRRVWHG